MIEMATMTPILLLLNCCFSKTIVAMVHSMNPIIGIVLTLLVSLDNL